MMHVRVCFCKPSDRPIDPPVYREQVSFGALPWEAIETLWKTTVKKKKRNEKPKDWQSIKK